MNLFDVVVLDNFSFNRLGLPANYAQNLAGFVKNGGALVAMGTDNIYSPSLNPAVLFDMLPAEVSPNRDSFVTWPAKCRPERHPVAELAGTDLESRLMWDQLAPLLGFTVFKGLKTGAEPVLSAVSPEGRTYPAAVTWRYGKGRVMALASASTWRWKMLAAENPVAAGAYGLFWNRVFSYLSGGLDIKPVTLSADGAALVEGEKGLFTLKVLGRDRNPLDDATAVISAEAVSAGNRKDTLVFRYVRPGVYQAELAELAQGRVAVRAAAVSNGVALGNDSAVFSVRGRGSDVSDLNVIDALAAELGGRAYLPAGLDLRDWSAAFPRPERAEEIVSRKPMSTAWYAGAVILMLLAAEWIIRRLRGIL